MHRSDVHYIHVYIYIDTYHIIRYHMISYPFYGIMSYHIMCSFCCMIAIKFLNNTI